MDFLDLVTLKIFQKSISHTIINKKYFYNYKIRVLYLEKLLILYYVESISNE